MDQFGQFLLKVVPRIKGKIQLTGLLVGLVIYLLTRTFQPENYLAHLTGGLVGISLIIFSLAFNFLSDIPAAQRANFVLRLFVMFCLVSSVLAGMTIFLLTNNARATVKAAEAAIQAKVQERITELDARRVQLSAKLTAALYGPTNEWLSVKSEIDQLDKQLLALKEQGSLTDQHLGMKIGYILSSVVNQSDSETNPRIEADRAIALLANGDLTGTLAALDRADAASRRMQGDAAMARAFVYNILGNLNEAISAAETATKLVPEQPRYHNFVGKLAEIQGRYADAERYYRNAYELYKGVANAVHQRTLTQKDLASVILLQGRNTEAELLLLEAATYTTADTLDAKLAKFAVQNDLGSLYIYDGRYKEARASFEVAFQIADEIGSDDVRTTAVLPSLFEALSNASFFFLSDGDFARARSLIDRSKKIQAQTGGTERIGFYVTLVNEAAINLRTGRHPEARFLLTRAGDGIRKTAGNNTLDLGNVFINFGHSYRLNGEVAESVSYYSKALDIYQGNFGEVNPMILRPLTFYIHGLLATGYGGDRSKYTPKLDLLKQVIKSNSDKRTLPIAGMVLGADEIMFGDPGAGEKMISDAIKSIPSYFGAHNSVRADACDVLATLTKVAKALGLPNIDSHLQDLRSCSTQA